MPRLTTPRRHSIACGCTDQEYAAIHAAAQRRGLRAGTYVRLLALGKPIPDVAAAPKATLDQEGLSQLARIGNSLNQIARSLNRKETTAAEALLTLEVIRAQTGTMTILMLGARTAPVSSTPPPAPPPAPGGTPVSAHGP